MTALTRRDRWIPWYFVLFFLVIACVDGIMVTLAIRTNSGIVTDHPYEKGLAYNQLIRAEAAQKKLGWKADIEFNGSVLHVSVQDAAGNRLVPDHMTARFTRPVMQGTDFEVVLQNGTAKVSLPGKGLWEIRIFATLDQSTYQQSKRVVVQ